MKTIKVVEKDNCYWIGESKMSNFIIKKVLFKTPEFYGKKGFVIAYLINEQNEQLVLLIQSAHNAYQLRTRLLAMGNFTFRHAKQLMAELIKHKEACKAIVM